MQNQEPDSNQDPLNEATNKTEDKKSQIKKYVMRIGKLMLLLTVVGCVLLTIASFAIDNLITTQFKKYGM